MKTYLIWKEGWGPGWLRKKKSTPCYFQNSWAPLILPILCYIFKHSSFCSGLVNNIMLRLLPSHHFGVYKKNELPTLDRLHSSLFEHPILLSVTNKDHLFCSLEKDVLSSIKTSWSMWNFLEELWEIFVEAYAMFITMQEPWVNARSRTSPTW